MKSVPPAPLLRHFLPSGVKGERLLIFAAARTIPDFLSARHLQAYAIARRNARKQTNLSPLDGERLAFSFPTQGGLAPPWVRRLDRVVDAIATAPLSPRMMIESLGISPQERIRWTKDGRLPQTSSAATEQGARRLRLVQYSVTLAARLLDEPAILAAWRALDASEEGA